MQSLLEKAQRLSESAEPIPFSVYSSVSEQQILNVPIARPLLVVVLSGIKEIMSDQLVTCEVDSFVFLPNSAQVDMRNIPANESYSALLIDFEYEDFTCLAPPQGHKPGFVHGEVSPLLSRALEQFLDWGALAPDSMWPLRRQELLQLIYHEGYTDISHMAEPPSLSYKLHQLICSDITSDWSAERLAAELAMSESTLRRKINAEGSQIQLIKDRAKLGLGLHLIQTTREPIGIIAERCGYQSQSRFTDKFKALYGLTPSELRKTRF